MTGLSSGFVGRCRWRSTSADGGVSNVRLCGSRVRVTALALMGFLMLGVAPSLRAFAPTDIGGLALWLDASDSSTITETDGNVSEWRDKSGLNRHAAQTTGANQPSVEADTLNGLGTLYFDGDTYLALSGEALSMLNAKSGVTVFAVSRYEAAGGRRYIFFCTTSAGGATTRVGFGSHDDFFELSGRRLDSDSWLRVVSDASDTMQWYIQGNVLDHGIDSIDTRVNGSVIHTSSFRGTGTYSATDSVTMMIARHGSAAPHFQGRIAEFVMFDEAISVGEAEIIEGYLAWKWGLESQLPAGHTYSDMPPSDAGYLPAAPLTLADTETGSTAFTNDETVELAGFPIPEGYDHFQLTTDGDVSAVGGSWTFTNAVPGTYPFDAPTADSNLVLYAWFTNTSEVVTLRRARGEIFYTEVAPQPAVHATLSLVRSPGEPLAILPEWIDDGSTGGVADGTAMAVHALLLTIDSGPDADATPGDPWVTVAVDGEYVLELTVMNEAGNTAVSAQSTVTVSEYDGPLAWTGNVSSDWFDPFNWDPNIVPFAGAEVTMASGSIVLDDSTAALDSFTQTGGTLTFRGWETILKAGTVVIGGTVTHDLNSDTTGTRLEYPGGWEPDNRVYIEAVNVTLNGTINVQEKGYGNTGGYDNRGYGPGASTLERGAASHAGRTYGYRAHTFTYGSLTEPTDPGSGGAGNYGGTGRPGGGVVRIDATGTVTVNGTINANGGDCSGQGGGASGGSVWITCNVLAGESGAIRAQGGNAPSHGGGGGGRVAVHVNPTAQAAASRPDVNLSARRGLGTGTGTGNNSPGQHGTVYITSPELISVTPVNAYGYYFGLPEWNFTFDSWTVTDSDFIFPTNLTLTVANDIVLDNVWLDFDPLATRSAPLGLDLNAGNLTIQNNSRVYVYAGTTNGTANAYGATVSVTGTLAVADGSILYPRAHPFDGSAIYFAVSNFTVSADSAIDADSRGFASGYGRGRGTGRGGAGHGGVGGTESTPSHVGGPVYGDPDAPIEPGSGSNNRAGGGGLWLEAQDTVTFDGLVTLRGAAGSNNNGAGAGGAVYILCRRIQGAGSIDAGGGNTSGSSGGGGGGRVAVTFNVDLFGSENVSVDGGVHDSVSGRNGDVGTIVWEWDPMGMYALVVEGDPEPHGTSAPYAYGQNTVEQDSTVTVTVDTPTDELEGQHYICIGWQATNALGQVVGSGLSNEAQFTVVTNTWLTWFWTNGWNLATSAGVNGSLSIDRTGWYTHGESVSVQAVPDGGYHFLQWIGDVPDADRHNNPVSLTMHQRRTVQAIFASNTPGEKTWSGTGSWFGNPENWIPAGHPGANDTVVIPAGSTCNLYDPTQVAGLTVNGTLNAETIEGIPNAADNLVTLTVTGDVTISGSGSRLRLYRSSLHGGADLTLLSNGQLDVYSRATGIPADYDDTHPPATAYGALVRVAGDMTVNTGCKVNPYAHPTDGGVPKFEMRNLFVAAGGEFDANHRGFTSGNGPGGTTNRGGAGYGGEGGDAYSAMRGGPTYGSTNAPVQPGSGGGGRAGGGTIWIEAQRTVEIDGLLTCHGRAGQHDIGTGSGGSIYIVCNRFMGAETGYLNARGGDTSGSSGGGGGGRIAVWSTHNTFNQDNVLVRGGTADNEDGVNAPNRQPGQPGTIVWGHIPPKGTLLMLR